jgi:hypothetical protein
LRYLLDEAQQRVMLIFTNLAIPDSRPLSLSGLAFTGFVPRSLTLRIEKASGSLVPWGDSCSPHGGIEFWG